MTDLPVRWGGYFKNFKNHFLKFLKSPNPQPPNPHLTSGRGEGNNPFTDCGLSKYLWTFSGYQALRGYLHILLFIGVHNNFSIFFKAAVHKSRNNFMVSATRTAFGRGEIWTSNRCVELWVWFHHKFFFTFVSTGL